MRAFDNTPSSHVCLVCANHTAFLLSPFSRATERMFRDGSQELWHRFGANRTFCHASFFFLFFSFFFCCCCRCRTRSLCSFLLNISSFFFLYSCVLLNKCHVLSAQRLRHKSSVVPGSLTPGDGTIATFDGQSSFSFCCSLLG